MGLPKLRRCSVALLLALAAVSGAAPARAQGTATTGKTLTVERIYSAPDLNGSMAQGVLWSPDGKQLSYFHAPDTVGDSAKELWVMDAATGKTSVLVNAETLASLLEPEKQKSTQATGLGRATPQDYQWAPDGRAILFMSDTALVWLDLASMKSKQLLETEAEIEDARISPDGKWVSYVQNFNLWTLNLASGEKKQITEGGSEEILERQARLGVSRRTFEPHGLLVVARFHSDRLFRNGRAPGNEICDLRHEQHIGGIDYHALSAAGEPNPIVRVGVIPASGGETNWLDTGADTNVYIARVNWLRPIANISHPAPESRARLVSICCSAIPAPARRTRFSPKKIITGSIVSDDLYFFSDSQRFLWTSERRNFRLIYLYDIIGKLLKQLTSGDWNVTRTEGFGPRSANGLIVDEAARRCLLFHSNKENPTRDAALSRFTE